MTEIEELDEQYFDDEDSPGPFCGLFGKTKHAELMQLFLSIPDMTLNQSQIARVISTTYQTVSKILRQFEKYEIVSLVDDNNTQGKIFKLNLDSPIVKFMDQLNIVIYAHNDENMLQFLQPITLPIHKKIEKKPFLELPEIGELTFSNAIEVSPEEDLEFLIDTNMKPNVVFIDVDSTSGEIDTRMGGLV